MDMEHDTISPSTVGDNPCPCNASDPFWVQFSTIGNVEMENKKEVPSDPQVTMNGAMELPNLNALNVTRLITFSIH